MPLTAEIIYRSLVLFTLLFLYTKLLKKKHLAEFRILDYMTSIVLGGIAAIHSSSLNLSLVSGVVSMTTWFLLALLFQYLSYHFKTFQRIQGQQTIVIRNGEFIRKNMKKERYTATDLLEDLRSKDIFNLEHVKYAVLEPSGRLNVLLKQEFQPLTEHALVNKGIADFKKISEFNIKNVERETAKHSTSQFTIQSGRPSKHFKKRLKNDPSTFIKKPKDHTSNTFITYPQLSMKYILPDYYF